MNIIEATKLAMRRFRIRRSSWRADFNLYYDAPTKQLKQYGCSNSISLTTDDLLADDYGTYSSQTTFKDVGVGRRFKIDHQYCSKIESVRIGEESTIYNSIREMPVPQAPEPCFVADQTIVELIV